MRHNEEDEGPHEPEKSHARCVKASKERSQPIKLNRFVNRPACGDRKEPGNWNREICNALERVVLCVETRMQPFTVCEFSEGNAEIVSKHPERIKQVGTAR